MAGLVLETTKQRNTALMSSAKLWSGMYTPALFGLDSQPIVVCCLLFGLLFLVLHQTNQTATTQNTNRDPVALVLWCSFFFKYCSLDFSLFSFGFPLGHANGVVCRCFSPDGSWILSASLDKTLKLWLASDGTSEQTLKGNTDVILCGCFSPDGARILSVSCERERVAWWRERYGRASHGAQMEPRGPNMEPNSFFMSFAKEMDQARLQPRNLAGTS